VTHQSLYRTAQAILNIVDVPSEWAVSAVKSSASIREVSLDLLK
jgi:hypothetical protein